MNTRILKAIDEVKIMLDTYTFQRDTTRIKNILTNIFEENLTEISNELNSLGELWYHDINEEYRNDKSYLLTLALEGIIQSIIDSSEDNLICMEYEIFHFIPKEFSI